VPVKETLFLRWRSPAFDAPAAIVWSPTGGWQHVGGSAAEIAARATGKHVVVFVPAADVRLTSVEVPARSAQKILQAAPYALEERIAEDVDDLHFALGPRLEGGGHAIAVLAKTRIEEWLASLSQAGLRADALVPEHLALPWTSDERMHLLAEPSEITARSAAYQGFSCAPEDLPTYLKIADPESRYTLRVLVPPDFQPDLTSSGRPVELLPGHRSALEILAKNWRPESSINLLQGAYSPSRERNRNWEMWRIPAALAAGWIFASLIATTVQAYRLNQQVVAQQARNVERFQSLFPEEKKIVDINVQAEQKIAALKSSGSSQGLLSLLQPTAAALSSVPGFTVQNLQFRDGALYLNLTGQDLQSLETLQQWFEQHPGTRFERESANAGSNGVQIRVKLSPA
jgi:general secretion pathway protein L